MNLALAPPLPHNQEVVKQRAVAVTTASASAVYKWEVGLASAILDISFVASKLESHEL
jgi:hypothetical protein